MPPAAKTPKPLIVAKHATTKFGGEAQIPFEYFKHMRRINADVHLLVHELTREELCEAFPKDIERLHFVSDSLINVWCYKLGRWLPDRVAYFTLGALSHFDTQLRQRRLAKALIGKHGFNIVHEPVPVSPKQPSMMFGLSVPVIIGPMNGGMDYPPNYAVGSRFERITISLLRWSSSFWNRIIRGKRQAALLLVANRRTYDALPSSVKDKTILQIPENGVDLERFCCQPERHRGETFRIVYLGRLVDWKRVDLLLAACAKLVKSLDFCLEIVGDGVLREALQNSAPGVALKDHVQFHGWLHQAAAAGLLRRADVLVLPSMRECGGAVVLEAMASGIPVIATDWGGPADYITDETGILVPPNPPEVFIEDLARAISWMAKHPDARLKMGKAGRDRVQALFDWQIKAKTILNIYQDVLNTTRTTFATA